MILKAVREAVGDEFFLDMRISGDEMVEGGMKIDEVIEFIKMAQEYIDMVNISAGLIVDWRAQFFTMPPYYQPHCLNVSLSRAVKECPDVTIPVTVVGCIANIDEAEEIIGSGAADAAIWRERFLPTPRCSRSHTAVSRNRCGRACAAIRVPMAGGTISRAQ